MFRAAATTTNKALKSATRSFHSPFAVLGSQMTATPSASVHSYDKQYDFSHEPVVSHSGHRCYVVSEPDPSNTHYEVPSGAYPTSTPYTNMAPAEASETSGRQFSSTGNGFAHPQAALQQK